MEHRHNEEQLTEELFRERKARYQGRLRGIIDAEITPGNIKSFMDDALSRLVELTEDASRYYSSIKTSEQGVNKTDIEDEAFTFLGLENIPALLDTIEKKRKELDMIDAHVPTSLKRVPIVHTPPDAQEGPEGEWGTEIKPKTNRERFKLALYVLVHDFQLDLKKVSLTAGTNTPNMMRRESYVTIDVPELNRILEVCDEVGNRTFVYNRKKLFELGKNADGLREMTKLEKRTWLRENPGSGISFVEGGHWRDDIAWYLSGDQDTALFEREVQNVEKSDDQSERLESLPFVARGENDVYRHFFEDNKGKHWGSVNAIAARLGLKEGALKRVVISIPKLLFQENAFRHTKGGIISKAYCLEDVVAHPSVQILLKDMGEKKGKESIAETGSEGTPDIAGFWRDEEGRRWGSVKRIATTLDVNAGMLKKIISETNGVSFKGNELLTPRGNIISKAYCLEEVKALPDVLKLMEDAQERRTKESVAKEDNEETGDIAGFRRDEKGRHWGSINAIAVRLSLKHAGLTDGAFEWMIRHTPELAFKENLLRDVSGNVIPKAYCLEEVETHPAMQELMKRASERETT